MARGRVAEQADEIDFSWARANDVETIARRLVGQYHPHLREAAIRAYFRPKARKVHQKVVVADIRLPSPLITAIAADLEFAVDYIITVGLDRWATIPDEKRGPWIDHELCHAAGRDPETEKWTLCAHDIEEFEAVVPRWGTTWRKDLDSFAKVCVQIPLLGIKDEA